MRQEGEVQGQGLLLKFIVAVYDFTRIFERKVVTFVCVCVCVCVRVRERERERAQAHHVFTCSPDFSIVYVFRLLK